MGKKHIDAEYLESIRIKVLVDYTLEHPQAQICKDYGISRATLYGILRKSGNVIKRSYARKLSDEQMKLISDLYSQGQDVNDIATQIGVGRSLVYHVLHELGVKPPNHKNRLPHFLNAEQEVEVVYLYKEERVGIRELMKRFNAADTVIYKILRRAGVERNHFSGPKAHFQKYVSPTGRMCRFRSTWEWAYAKYLDERNLDWAYESHTYMLSDGTAYTPDFWIPEWSVLVEVKGYMTDEARRKIYLFRSDYPHLKLLVVDKQAFKLYGISLANKKATA
jgi:transposase